MKNNKKKSANTRSDIQDRRTSLPNEPGQVVINARKLDPQLEAFLKRKRLESERNARINGITREKNEEIRQKLTKKINQITNNS